MEQGGKIHILQTAAVQEKTIGYELDGMQGCQVDAREGAAAHQEARLHLLHMEQGGKVHILQTAATGKKTIRYDLDGVQGRQVDAREGAARM